MRFVSILFAFLLFAWHGGACVLQLTEGLWYTTVSFGLAEPLPMSASDMTATDVAFLSPWVGPVLLGMSGLRGVAALTMLAAAAFTYAQRRGPALGLCGLAFVAHLAWAPLALFMLWTLEPVYGTAFYEDWEMFLGDAVDTWSSVRYAWIPWILVSVLSSPVAAGLIRSGARPPEA